MFARSAGDISKPEEIFHIIEHFCLGRRRLHLFGTDDCIRPGTHTPVESEMDSEVLFFMSQHFGQSHQLYIKPLPNFA